MRHKQAMVGGNPIWPVAMLSFSLFVFELIFAIFLWKQFFKFCIYVCKIIYTTRKMLKNMDVIPKICNADKKFKCYQDLGYPLLY